MTYLFTLYFCDDIFTEVKISLLYSSLGDEDEKSRAAECLRSSVEICIQRIRNKTFLKVCLVLHLKEIDSVSPSVLPQIAIWMKYYYC